MKATKTPTATDDLHARAEAAFRSRAASLETQAAKTPEAMLALLHELEVHQIELELQNEELRRAQLKLEISHARYFNFYNHAPVGYSTVGEDGIIKEANLTLAMLLGVEWGALVRQPFTRFILKDDQDLFYLLRKQIPESREAQGCELRMVRSDGTACWVNIIATGDASEEGEARFRLVVTDITTRKQAEMALRESEDRLKFAAEATLDGLWDYDIPSGSVHFSPQWARLLGYEPGELPPRVESFSALVHSDDVVLVQRAQEDHFAGRSLVKQCEIRLRMKSGEYRWFLDCGKVVARNAAGEPSRMVGTISDITARKHTDSLLRRSEQRLKDAQAIAHLGNFHWDARTNKVVWSDELYRIYGREPGDFEPSFDNYIAAIHPEDRPQITETLRGAMGANGVFFHDYRIVLPAGEERWVHARGYALTDSEGHFSGMEGICQDITERKQAEAKSHEIRILLQSITESTSDAIYVKDTEGRYLVFNAAASRYVGKPASEVLCRDDTALFPPDQARQVMEGDRKVMASGHPQTYEEYLTTNVGTTTFLSTKGPIRDAHGKVVGLFGIARDITERNRVEAELVKTHAHLVEAQRIAHLGAWYLDTATDQVTWSEELYKMFGANPALPPPDYHEQSKLFTPESWARLSAAVPRTLATGQFYELELETVRADGRHGWMWARGEVLRDAAGQTIGLQGVAQDIAARKQTELALRQLNDELEERVAERTLELKHSNDELDAFAHSVSHDLRAPLRAISGFGEFLTEEYSVGIDERGRGFLRQITEAAGQMSELVEDLLEFAHSARAGLRRQQVNLSALAHEVVIKLNQSQPKRQVAFHCATSLVVNGDPRLLTVVLINLLGNAWKYTSKTAEPRVEFGQLHRDGGNAFFIRDNGAGFDMQYVDRLFGAFQRLHSAAEFEGTGVGLATVQRIIHRHGGKIWAEAKVNAGATFYFTLPDPAAEASPARTHSDLQSNVSRTTSH